MPKLASACVRAPRASRPGPARRAGEHCAPARVPRPRRRRRLPRAARDGGPRPRLPHGQLRPGGGPDAGRLRRPARGLALPPARQHPRLARARRAAARRRHDRLGRARARRPRATRGDQPRRCPTDRSIDPDMRLAIRACMARLSQPQQKIVALRLLQGLSVRALRADARDERGRRAHALPARAARAAGRARPGRGGGALMSDALAAAGAAPRTAAERVRAARLLARSDAADEEALVLRLLRDPGSTAVSEAMVTSLLEARREGADPPHPALARSARGCRADERAVPARGPAQQRARRRRGAREHRLGAAGDACAGRAAGGACGDRLARAQRRLPGAAAGARARARARQRLQRRIREAAGRALAALSSREPQPGSES